MLGCGASQAILIQQIGEIWKAFVRINYRLLIEETDILRAY